MLSLVVIYLPNLFSYQKSSSDLLVATALGRPEHHCSRFNILRVMQDAQPEAEDSAYLPYRATGGAERDRTVDPLLAKQVLSQLSYSPTSKPG